MHQAGQEVAGASNHPLAKRMAAIAFINQNIAIGCLLGSLSVLLSAVETRLHVGRELSTLAFPVVNLSCAICAPLAGSLAARYPLRRLMLAGAVFSTAGFALLSVINTYPLYLAVFGLLFGPGMAAGIVLPGTLVTRWFAVNRGKALGIVSTPLVVALVPLSSNWVLQNYGLPATYLALAGVSAVSVVVNFFIIERPPGYAAPSISAAHGPTSPAGIGAPQLLGAPRFWALVLAYIASSTSSIVIAAHMVPLARSWGFSATLAATLLTIESLVGMAGTLFFGWLADRIGAALTLALLVFDGAVLWLLLLIHPSFPAAAVLLGLIGLNAAGAVPVLGLALSQAFGRESYGRAFGLANLVNLPFSVLCVPMVSLVFTRTGSYADAIIGIAIFLGVTSLLPLSARQRQVKIATSV